MLTLKRKLPQKERVLATVEIHPHDSLDVRNDLEQHAVRRCEDDGNIVVAIMISIYPRPEYPKGLIEIYSLRNGVKQLKLRKTTISE